MNTTIKQFFRKYLYSNILVLLIFLIANLIFFFSIILIIKNTSEEEVFPITEFVDNINVDKKQKITVNSKSTNILKEKNSWAMILDDSGTVIWEEYMPENLPRSYTSSDIARFSRWYLEDFPVLIQTLPSGLLVIGLPKQSIGKYNYFLDTNTMKILIYSVGIFIVMNFLLMFTLSGWNTRKIEKAIKPILTGINSLSKGQYVLLPKKGELGTINEELNTASQYIGKKEEARKDWISGISHDIRTPLTIMLGYAGEIEKNSNLPTETRAKAEIICIQGDKLRKLISDLNLTSKLEYSMQPLNIKKINPVELIRLVISDFLNNDINMKHKINMVVENNLNELSIQGDLTLLSRMLNNLVQNSIDHNPNGCNIVVKASTTKNYLQYIVTDDGIGLSEKQLNMLNTGLTFEGKSKSNDGIPHGIGLKLVKQITHAHKGDVSYKNNVPNGLVVTVSLPIKHVQD
ncbi:sensor histidine kinase [Vagococcus elongatus]|uniref:histidine kinase n=1 Tax=Vagococcus elongatus TaxID=180344 RepID=A0A430ALB5_9ENTE|nr:HAMP domain-containing sensor histidine kinase [Vagococcus elongatus]RSU08876.1 hypothetical protein CBF29_13035 [Vagococcus elongatus]